MGQLHEPSMRRLVKRSSSLPSGGPGLFNMTLQLSMAHAALNLAQ